MTMISTLGLYKNIHIGPECTVRYNNDCVCRPFVWIVVKGRILGILPYFGSSEIHTSEGWLMGYK